ncbi:RNA polymerase sigma factor [Glaciecola sp. 1036]|uniref:RNA polymerase sigma factor n=1 Tax=Alteromonadaceae TaxID=72275 RepID=UPI003D0027C2
MKNNSPEHIEESVEQALEGNRESMESVLRAIRKDIYSLSIRFLMSPADAEDVTQEILLKIMLRLAKFEGKSSFKTWVYRVTTNHLLDHKKANSQHLMSLDDFSLDLSMGLNNTVESSLYDARLLAEVRVGCTLALLNCLTPDKRVAYILGDILELEHTEAAYILNESSAAYRKRLSRARELVVNSMTQNCGLINKQALCRCHKRVETAKSLGRVSENKLIFMTSSGDASRFPHILEKIRALEGAQSTAALFRAHNVQVTQDTFNFWLKSVISQHH